MATFDLDYNGLPFVVPTADLLATVARWLPATAAVPFRYDPGSDTDLDFGIPTIRQSLTDPLYELFIPTSASRWAFFRGLMAAADVSVLVGNVSPGSCYSNSGSPDLQIKVFTAKVDGVTTIQRYMYMLPPMPLVGLNGGADLYLVTLVDARYYAQFGSVGSGAGGGTTWASFNNWQQMITTALAQAGMNSAAYPGGPSGAPSTYGTWPPESLYGQPDIDSDFYAFAGPPGIMADAALAATGRVVTGDYTVIKWADANTFATAARSANATNRAAGGVLWPQHQSGSTELPLVAHLPAEVTVAFPWWNDGMGYRQADPASAKTDDFDPRSHASDGEYGYNYSLTYLASSLGAPYSSLVFDGSTAGINLNLRTTAKAVFTPDNSAGVQNATQLNNLGTQLAKDFYDAQLQSVTETYVGLVTFDYKAAFDVSYCFYPEAMTRISRRPLNEYPSRFGHGFGDQSAPERVQLCKPTGPVSGGFYPAVIAPGGGSTGVTCYLSPTNGETLSVGVNYPAIRAKTSFNGSPARPIYYTAIVGATSALTVGTTTITGGSAGNVLYTNGSTLQGAANLDIAGTSGPGGTPEPFIQAATGKWVSFAIGSH